MRNKFMDLYERIEKMRALLAATASHKIESKKKLHKLIYLLQQKGEDFDQDYTFHYYGVFSPSLAGDLDTAKKWALINVEEPEEGQLAYTISLPKGSQIESISSISENSIIILNTLAQKDPQYLEVLSTIVYLDRNFYKGDELKQKLQELKPDLERHYTEAFKIANELFNIKV
jgi:uncharacterized protein